jgi:hypothetical protein
MEQKMKQIEVEELYNKNSFISSLKYGALNSQNDNDMANLALKNILGGQSQIYTGKNKETYSAVNNGE